MSMASLNISLPQPLKDYVEAQVKGSGYSTPSEFVRELLRQDQKRRAWKNWRKPYWKVSIPEMPCRSRPRIGRRNAGNWPRGIPARFPSGEFRACDPAQSGFQHRSEVCGGTAPYAGPDCREPGNGVALHGTASQGGVGASVPGQRPLCGVPHFLPARQRRDRSLACVARLPRIENRVKRWGGGLIGYGVTK